MKKKLSKIAIEVKSKIRQIMSDRSITQKELAERMETSQQNINNLLNHNKDITITEMEHTAKALHVDMNDLIPQNIIQNNNAETKDNLQRLSFSNKCTTENTQNIIINDSNLIEKIVEVQQTSNELMKQMIELLSRK